jgi:hypothetical protein
MVDVQTISIVVAAVGVFIAAINSIYSSRRAERQRETQLFMQLYNRWNTKDMAKQYGKLRYLHRLESADDWYRMTGVDTNSQDPTWKDDVQERHMDTYAEFQSMSEFFEGIGVLVKRQLIDIDVVEDLLANRIIWWWEKFRLVSQIAREGTGDSKLHDHTEYLYNIMKQRQQTPIIT